MNVSINKIRKLPYLERIKLVSCLPLSEQKKEYLEIAKDNPSKDLSEILILLAQNYSAIDLLAFLTFPNIDLLGFFECFKYATSKVFLEYTVLWKCLLNALPKHKRDDPNYHEVVNLCINELADKIKSSINDAIRLEYTALLDVDGDITPIINALLFHIDSEVVRNNLKTFAYRFPESHSLREFIIVNIDIHMMLR